MFDINDYFKLKVADWCPANRIYVFNPDEVFNTMLRTGVSEELAILDLARRGRVVRVDLSPPSDRESLIARFMEHYVQTRNRGDVMLQCRKREYNVFDEPADWTDTEAASWDFSEHDYQLVLTDAGGKWKPLYSTCSVYGWESFGADARVIVKPSPRHVAITQEFQGRVTGYRNGEVMVEDMEGNTYCCDLDQLEPA